MHFLLLYLKGKCMGEFIFLTGKVTPYIFCLPAHVTFWLFQNITSTTSECLFLAFMQVKHL